MGLKGYLDKTFGGLTISSPCISVCELDDSNVCKGCFRTIDEIRDWGVMTREQKLQVLENSELRKACAGICAKQGGSD